MRKLLFILVAVFCFGTVAQASILSLSPADLTGPNAVQEGDTFSLQVSIDLLTDVNGGRVFIDYDENFLEFDTASGFGFASGPWNDGGALDVADAIVDATAGTIDLRISAGFDSFDGMLVIGNFNLIALATTQLTSVIFDDSAVPPTSRWGFQGSAIQLDFVGSDITINPIPLPAAAYLFPAGLIAGLGWMRRRGRSSE